VNSKQVISKQAYGGSQSPRHPKLSTS